MDELVPALRAAGVRRGDLVALCPADDGTFTIAVGPADGPAPEGTAPEDTAASRTWRVTADAVADAERALRPRWVTWSQGTAQRLAGQGVRLATAWDIAAVHRLLFGGWRADPAFAWACLHGQPPSALPPPGRGPDLFSLAEQDEQPLGAAEVLTAARLQLAALDEQGGGRRVSTARSESTAELLCAELAADGLPVSRVALEGLLADIIGPRPRTPADAAAVRAGRDARVLRHAPEGSSFDLRSPLQVKALLLAAGIDVPDTRAHRLEPFRDHSPLVAALLEWRKAERIATTYGYAWLDENLGADGRLRGAWTGSDGAAGRMTASAGLHNMPAHLRTAVQAEEGYRLVRADLGQIEPRVLAAVSGDAALIAATAADDMYLPVAAGLGVDRPTAKVAMIAAMYGQTTGHGGTAARRMRVAYPVAMGYLDAADRSAQAGRDLHTYGGRRLRMSGGAAGSLTGAAPAAAPGAGPSAGPAASSREAPGSREAPDGSDPARDSARAAGRGRYGRNAVIQGAAAELFKMWAVTVRARTGPLDARIVLCLHDELLVHAPAGRADEVAGMLGDCLAEASRRWAPDLPAPVRFIAEISVAGSWAEAKA